MVAPQQTTPLSPEFPSRERMLLAAKKLFAEKGYENTSTASIARMAGTSESQLVKHFGSKEGLLEAVFEAGWGQIKTRVPEVLSQATPKERLFKLLDVIFVGVEEDEELKELMLLESRRIRRDQGQVVLITESYRQMIALVDRFLNEMKAAGQVREDVNLEAVRSAISGMAEGMVRDQVLARREGYPAHFSAKELRHVLDVFVDSLA